MDRKTLTKCNKLHFDNHKLAFTQYQQLIAKPYGRDMIAQRLVEEIGTAMEVNDTEDRLRRLSLCRIMLAMLTCKVEMDHAAEVEIDKTIAADAEAATEAMYGPDPDAKDKRSASERSYGRAMSKPDDGPTPGIGMMDS